MPAALFTLILCQLIGEVLRSALHLPIPGPVIGMFLLAATLVVRRQPAPEPLAQTSCMLITHMGLLFVPAGVGIIAQLGLLRQQWLPVAAALLGSTMLGLLVTAAVLHIITRAAGARQTAPAHRRGVEVYP